MVNDSIERYLSDSSGFSFVAFSVAKSCEIFSNFVLASEYIIRC